MKVKCFLLTMFCLSLTACAPSKNKLAMMNNYDLCEMIYKLQNSAETWNTKYYWEELQSRKASCEPYAAQIRQQQSLQQGQILNFIGTMGLATGVSSSGQSNVSPSTTNNTYVQPKPLPPVIITPPNTIPKK